MKDFRICCFALVASCSAATAAEDTTLKKVVKAKAEEIHNAIFKEDYNKVIDLTHPNVLKMLGSRDKMIALLESGMKEMKSRGFAFRSATMDDPSDPVTADLQATFFDPWLQAHSDADFEKVPADMVLASGSGLDPHITVRNARYQLDRVVEKRAAKPADTDRVKDGLNKLIEKHAFTPLSGLVGEPLVNVLELNIDVDQEFPVPVGAKTP